VLGIGILLTTATPARRDLIASHGFYYLRLVMDFLVQILWPELLNVFDRAALDKQVLEGHLCDYVEKMRGGRTVVPQKLESFYARNRGQGHSPRSEFSIPAKGSTELRKLLYDAGRHFGYLDVLLGPGSASSSPDSLTEVLPTFQGQVQLLRYALEPLGIEDSLEWLELSVDDFLLRSETLSRLQELIDSLWSRFHGDHLFFVLSVHARHYLSSHLLSPGHPEWAKQKDIELQQMLEFATILHIRDHVVSDFVSSVHNLGWSNAEHALTMLKEAVFESNAFELESSELEI
jgi:hypothetical protein